MFERQVLGEDYWKKQAATQADALSLRRAALRRAGARRGLDRAAALQHHLHQEARRRAGRDLLPARGRADHPLCGRHPQDRQNPNAAKLFLNWRLSEEGQAFMIKELGNLTSLKEPPLYPAGFDPKVIKVWVPNFESSRSCASAWIEEWNKTYGYRQ